ncbi:MAG TPA: hypothetical protein VF543_05745 [Pyrinomonadaceae bacterium]|jgi:hypothetical protein
MAQEQIIIADLTKEMTRIGITSTDTGKVIVPENFNFPLRVAVRHSPSGLLTLAGDEVTDAKADAQTLVFNRLNRLLPRIEDEELQVQLSSALWSALCTTLARDGLIDSEKRNVGYIIPHHLSTQSLLENFRIASAGENRVSICGYVHEATALVIGFLRSLNFKLDEMDFSSMKTILLILVHDEQNIEVVCFNYAKESASHHHILVRDFFHTSGDQLYERFAESDWLKDLSLIISVENASIPEEGRRGLISSLEPLAGATAKKRYYTGGTAKLKIKGAAYIAQCCEGQTTASDEYHIATAFNVGIQIDQQRFHPLLTKDEMAGIETYPHQIAQPFKISGEPGPELSINLLCGYGEQVRDSILLCRMKITGDSLAKITREKEPLILVVLRFDSPGSGEVVLGPVSGNQTLERRKFILPGLVL